MLIVGQEHSPRQATKIKVSRLLNALAFSSNGEYLVSGCTEGVRVWRVEDGKQMARMAAPYVRCIAVSKEGKIAAGTYFGELIVWEALPDRRYKKVLTLEGISDIYGVDFSPDSARIVTASAGSTASVTVWDIATQGQLATLHHDEVVAAKYSPDGDRIATTGPNSIRVYDSSDWRLLVDIPVKVTNTGFLWSKAHLFVVSDGKIKQIDASTGSAIYELPVVPADNEFGRIALPTHGEFIAYSTNRTVTFWDASSHAQLGLIHHSQNICSITLSPDDRFIAIGGEGGKITIKRLSHFTVSALFSSDHVLSQQSQEPAIQVDDAVLDSWKHVQLANTEALLTAAIPRSRNTIHHVLACRALVRARLRQWDTAVSDAGQVIPGYLFYVFVLTMYAKSVKIQPSVIGLIARSVALVGNGKKLEAYRACDIAFEHSHSTYVSFILLIKVCPIHSNLIHRHLCWTGYHSVYGRGARRCDITRRQPYRYCALQFNMSCGSGTHATIQQIFPLTFPVGIYVSSPWKLAHGE